MLLKTIATNPLEAWQYIERYVNKGSESGFDKINNTIPVYTSPYSDTKQYPLDVYDCSQLETESLSACHSSDILQPNEFVLHPGNIILSSDNEIIKRAVDKLIFKNRNRYIATPTSSSRTVFISSSNKCLGFFKLHYDGLVGRVNRSISKKQALSSIELTEMIVKAIEKKILPHNLHFFKEPFAKVVRNDDYEMAYVFRELNPFPYNENIKYIIPMFSLFSKDKYALNDATLLQQLFEAQNLSIEQFILNSIIYPIFNCYFELLLTIGLQPEWQAQNVLLGLDNDFKVIGIIFRDLESIDKDIELMKNLDFHKNNIYPFFKSYDYKCIWYNYRPLTKDSYQVKHSFMFDFKLCRYLIMPLIECAKTFSNIDIIKVEKEITDFNQQFIKKLPVGFFPKNCWYNYANIVLDRTKPRPFVSNSNVLFR